MATPSQAELETQLKNLVDLLEEVRKFGETNAKNLLGMVNTAEQAMEGDYLATQASTMASMRSDLASLLSRGSGLLTAHLRDWAKFIDSPNVEGSVQDILTDMYEYWIQNSINVTTRGFTYSAISSTSSNVGTGTIVLLKKDENDLDIENINAEALMAECVVDANSGSDKGKEVFQFRSGSAAKDIVETLGSGIETEITAAHPDNGLLLNASFDDNSGTNAAPTGITNWTSTVTVNSTNFAMDTTNVYLPAPDDTTTVKALTCKVTNTLSQKINIRRTALNPNAPHFLQVAWNRAVGSFVGSFVLHMGATSRTTTIVGSTSGWNVSTITVGSKWNWLKQFNEDDLDIKIAITRSSGTLLIDDVIFVEYEPFAGLWYVVTPGATPFQATSQTEPHGDKFTWSVTNSSDTKIQRMIDLMFGRFLPHAASGSISDP